MLKLNVEKVVSQKEYEENLALLETWFEESQAANPCSEKVRKEVEPRLKECARIIASFPPECWEELFGMFKNFFKGISVQNKKAV